MYRSEKLFVNKFIACLKKLNVDDIPFGNNSFYKGIENMHQYFISNKEDLGKYRNELSLLFLRRPIEGVYDEFADVILEQNGRLMSFILKNPYYEKAEIKIDEEDAEYLLRNNDLDMAELHLFEFAKLFCRGAGISYSN